MVATYTYDGLNRMANIAYAIGSAPVGNVGYGYDGLGRRITVNGSLARSNFPAAVGSTVYDAANELTNWNGGTLSYDGNGNMLAGYTGTPGLVSDTSVTLQSPYNVAALAKLLRWLGNLPNGLDPNGNLARLPQ